MDEIRIGIVGMGPRGSRAWLRNCQQVRGCRVTALCDGGMFIEAKRRGYDVPIAYQPACYGPGGKNTAVPVEEMADYAVRARAEGINLVGTCCGSRPEHTRAMAKALGVERRS